MRHDFSEAYKILCRSIWYDRGCPSSNKLLEVLPPDELGEVPGLSALRHWMDDGNWHDWREVMDAELSVKAEEKIIQTRIKQIEDQLNKNIAIGDKAFKEIMEKPFDSSAAANQAWFKSTAEARGLMQIQKVIEDMTKLETPDIKQKIKELAERANATAVEEKEEVAEPLD